MRQKMMAILVIGLFVGAGALLFFGGGGRHPISINSGYSGIDASFYSIEHDYGVATTTVRLGLSSMEIYPKYTTGLYAELSQPMIASYEDDYNKVISVKDGDNNVTTTYKAQIVHLSMSVMLRTAGDQMPEITSVVFNIRLRQNENSFFQTADSSYAAIVAVRTSQVPEIGPSGAVFQVDPASSNFEVELTSLRTLQVPQWVLDSGYQKTIGDYADATFPIRVIRAEPMGVIQQFRTEAQAGMRFEIDALLFGEWVATKPWRPTGFPDITAWWENLLVAIGQFLGVVVGIIITAVILIKVKKPKLAVIGVVIVWVSLAYLMGWLDPLLAQLGGLTGG